MKVYTGAYVTNYAAYSNAKSLIIGTQRIPFEHNSHYWQTANANHPMTPDFEDKEVIEIDKAIYVGGLSEHFGHFLIEGLSRLCDVVNYDLPVILRKGYGGIPKGREGMKDSDRDWVINTLVGQNEIINNNPDVILHVKKLYVPERPFFLSYTATEPWRMTPLITKLTNEARKLHPEVENVDSLFLKRLKGNKNRPYKTDAVHNPRDPLSKQIAMASRADNLRGTIGSNTHLSLFAKWDANLEWKPRNDYREGMRTQLICDLIKTYNEHDRDYIF